MADSKDRYPVLLGTPVQPPAKSEVMGTDKDKSTGPVVYGKEVGTEPGQVKSLEPDYPVLFGRSKKPAPGNS